MTDIKIDKIRLKIGEQEVEMTMAQARDLQKVFNDMWPGGTGPMQVPYPPDPQSTLERQLRDPEYPSWGTPRVTCEMAGNVVCVTSVL